MTERYITTISKRGQTSVPAALDLEPGQKLVWRPPLHDGKILTLEVTVIPRNPVQAMRGYFAGMGFGGVASLIRERRKDKKKEQMKERMFSKKKS